MTSTFGHENFIVYQRAISFILWLQQILKKIPKPSSIHNQLRRASTSISLNLAEGNEKWSRKDRCPFFGIARGSALEWAAGLDFRVAKKSFDPGNVVEGKAILLDIVRMTIGPIEATDSRRSLDKTEFRVGEREEISYLDEGDKDKD